MMRRFAALRSDPRGDSGRTSPPASSLPGNRWLKFPLGGLPQSPTAPTGRWRVIALLCASLILAIGWVSPSPAVAQENDAETTTAADDTSDAWPDYTFQKQHSADRGPGGYLAWWKLLLLWLTFLFWVKFTDWTSQDCQKFRLPYATWVPAVFLPFPICLICITLLVPVFLAGFPLLVLSLAVPVLIYVVKRNGQVEPHDKVMTRDHWRHLMAGFLGKAGVEVGDAKKRHEKGAPVTFAPVGPDETKNQASLVAARQSDGYLPAKDIVANAIDHRADKIMMDYSPEAVTVRYQVDGVWHDGEAQEREEGDMALAVLKILAGLNQEDRRSRQQGRVDVTLNGTKYGCTLVSQGTKTGERVMIQMVGKKTTFQNLAELGMREKMIEQFKTLMLSENGIILFSSMPGGGLSTTLNVSLRTTDRLLRDFLSLEDEVDRLEEVENVDPTTYNSSTGQTPAELLPSLLRKQPDVLIVPELPNAETVKILCQASTEEQLIFSTIRAKEAVESLLRVLLLKVPAKSFAPVVQGVLNQRLVRKLCETCKEAYEPPPALLQKLGIPAGRIEQLYRHPEEPEEICPDCHGIGYRGRTAIFELMIVDDTMRQTLIQQPKLEALRQASRKAGNRSLQEEGIGAVVRGVTSLPELMRVLKQ